MAASSVFRDLLSSLVDLDQSQVWMDGREKRRASFSVAGRTGGWGGVSHRLMGGWALASTFFGCLWVSSAKWQSARFCCVFNFPLHRKTTFVGFFVTHLAGEFFALERMEHPSYAALQLSLS